MVVLRAKRAATAASDSGIAVEGVGVGEPLGVPVGVGDGVGEAVADALPLRLPLPEGDMVMVGGGLSVVAEGEGELLAEAEAGAERVAGTAVGDAALEALAVVETLAHAVREPGAITLGHATRSGTRMPAS